MACDRGLQRPRHHPWVILVTAYIIIAVCIGHLYTLGTLFPDIMESFNINRAKASVVQSAAYGLFGIGGIFYGSFITRKGPQFACITGTMLATAGLLISFFATSIVYLTISFGVISAIGCGMQFISCNVVVGQSFKDRQGNIALSVLSMASSIGAMGYSFVMAYLLDPYGLRGTLLILAAMTMHGLPLALMWPSQPRSVVQKTENTVIDASTSKKNSKHASSTQDNDEVVKHADTSQEVQRKNGDSSIKLLSSSDTDVIKSALRKDGTTNLLTVNNPTFVDEENLANQNATVSINAKMGVVQGLVHVVRNVNFILLTIALTIAMPVSFIILIIVVDLILDKGFTSTDGSTALVIINVFGIVGRLAPGFILLLPKMTALSIPIIASLLGFVSYVMLPFANSLPSLFIVCALSGTAFGVMSSCITVTVLSLVGKEYMSNAVGIVFTVVGIALTTCGPLTGYIRDQTGSYTPSLLSAAVAMAIGAVICGVNQFLQHRQSRAQGRRYSTSPKCDVPV